MVRNLKYIIKNNNDKKEVENIYEEYKLCMKQMLFYIWEIDKYINLNSYIYLKICDEDNKYTKVYDNNFMLRNCEQFKVENNENKFIDLKDNLYEYIKFFKELEKLM